MFMTNPQGAFCMRMAGPGSLKPFKTIVARIFFLVTYPKGEFLGENGRIFMKKGGICTKNDGIFVGVPLPEAGRGSERALTIVLRKVIFFLMSCP